MSLSSRLFVVRVLVVVFSASFWNGAARAQSIGILPFERVTSAKKSGATLVDDIEVFNNTGVPVQVSTEVRDWSLSRDGQKLYAPVGSSPQSLGAVLRLNPSDFSIPPHKSQRVRYSIAVPADLSRELRAMIFFTTRPLPVAGQGVRINIATRIGCSLFLLPPKKLVGNIAAQPKISALKIAENPAQLVVSVENAGLASTRLSGTIQAINASGVVVAQGTMPRTQLLSGGARDIVARWKTTLPPGDYTFKAVIDGGKGQLVAGQLRASLAVPIAALPEQPNTKTPKHDASKSTALKRVVP